MAIRLTGIAPTVALAVATRHEEDEAAVHRAVEVVTPGWWAETLTSRSRQILSFTHRDPRVTLVS